MAVQSAKELTVYKKAYALAMQVFDVSKPFPVEERLALTGQIRRSSRSVCNNLREAWAKRRYTSLDFARDCGYITETEHRKPTAECAEVGRMLGSMINNPGPFLLHQTADSRRDS